MQKKFGGSLVAIMMSGADYHVSERFRVLSGAGKPLWEMKEHDHRWYCHRYVIPGTKSVQIFLFNGWVKDKKGKTERENREIAKAIGFYHQFLQENRGGHV